MTKYKRIITIVLDSVGVGASEDAKDYGDLGSDTLGNTARAVGGVKLENLQKLGLGNLHNVMGVKPSDNPLAYYTKLSEKSVGKDTMTGHWEIMGLYTQTPFITFTETGFPDELIAELEEKTIEKYGQFIEIIDGQHRTLAFFYDVETLKKLEMIIYA